MGGKNLVTGEIEPGWNYGESIGGGVGAGEGYNGESGVHVSPALLLLRECWDVNSRYLGSLYKHSSNR